MKNKNFNTLALYRTDCDYKFYSRLKRIKLGISVCLFLASGAMQSLASAEEALPPKLIDTIIPHSSTYILDVNDITNKIYVANYDEVGTVSIIDGLTNKIVDVIPAGNYPDSATVNKKTNRIYVTNNESGTMTVIDGVTNSILASTLLGSGPALPDGCHDNGGCVTGSGPMLAAVNEKTNRIYVATWEGNVAVVDGTSNKVIASIPTGINPYVLATNKKTNKIYVANVNDSTISVIDGKKNIVIKNIVVDNGPFWVAVNEETNKIYVTNSDYNKLYVIDGKTDTVKKTIPLSGYPLGVALNQKTNIIYVAKYLESSIVAIDGETDRIIGSPVSVGTAAAPLGCNINTCTNFGSGSFDIAVNQKTNQVYVLNLGDNSIAVLDGQSYENEPHK